MHGGLIVDQSTSGRPLYSEGEEADPREQILEYRDERYTDTEIYIGRLSDPALKLTDSPFNCLGGRPRASLKTARGHRPQARGHIIYTPKKLLPNLYPSP